MKRKFPTRTPCIQPQAPRGRRTTKEKAGLPRTCQQRTKASRGKAQRTRERAATGGEWGRRTYGRRAPSVGDLAITNLRRSRRNPSRRCRSYLRGRAATRPPRSRRRLRHSHSHLRQARPASYRHPGDRPRPVRRQPPPSHQQGTGRRPRCHRHHRIPPTRTRRPRGTDEGKGSEKGGEEARSGESARATESDSASATARGPDPHREPSRRWQQPLPGYPHRPRLQQPNAMATCHASKHLPTSATRPHMPPCAEGRRKPSASERASQEPVRHQHSNRRCCRYENPLNARKTASPTKSESTRRSESASANESASESAMGRKSSKVRATDRYRHSNHYHCRYRRPMANSRPTEPAARSAARPAPFRRGGLWRPERRERIRPLFSSCPALGATRTLPFRSLPAPAPVAPFGIRDRWK